MSSSSSETVVVEKPKRGPGRPPKKRTVNILRRDGIVDTPSYSSSYLEFVYDNPIIFKNLFSYFKHLGAISILMRCSPSGLTFFARDSSRSCRVVATILGDQVNHYYCKKTIWLSIHREMVEKIFTSIDKSFFKITIIYKEDEPENLNVIFKDGDLDKECNYRIVLSAFEEDRELTSAERISSEDYPIEFQLSAKQFKKSITDASHNSDVIIFEKTSETDLQLSYSKSGILYNEIYRSPDKILLRSEIDEGDSFYYPISLQNVKPLAGAIVTENVKILCKEGTDLLLRCECDPLIMNTFIAAD